MISSTASYALRAVVHLVRQHDVFIGRAVIAEATLVPVDYQPKILNELIIEGRLVDEAFKNATSAELIPARKRSRTCDFPKKQPPN